MDYNQCGSIGMPRNINIIILLCIVIVEHYYCLIAGGFSNVIYFKNISQGLHTFTVVARDKDGLVDRSEVHFEGTCIFEIVSCIIIIGHDFCMHAWQGVSIVLGLILYYVTSMSL